MDNSHTLYAEIGVVKSQQERDRREFENIVKEVTRLGQRGSEVNIEVIHLRTSVDKLGDNIDKLADTVDRVNDRMNDNMKELRNDLRDVSASNLRWALGVATTLISVTLTLTVTMG